jgi:hypothetical protein
MRRIFIHEERVMLQRNLLPILALLCGILGSLGPARADEPSPAAIAKAKELLAAEKSLETSDALLGVIVGNTEKLLESANPGRGPESREFMEKFFLPEARRRLPEFIDMIAALWARYYSIEDMDTMIAFFRSKTGQKLIALQPRLLQDQMNLGGMWGATVARDTFRKFEPQLKQQGLTSPNI